MKRPNCNCPSWLPHEARPRWRKLIANLYAMRQPTPLERVGVALLAEQQELANVAGTAEERRAWGIRAASLEVALRLEPIESKRRASA